MVCECVCVGVGRARRQWANIFVIVNRCERERVKCSFISGKTPLLSISNAPRRRFLPGRHFSIFALSLSGWNEEGAVYVEPVWQTTNERHGNGGRR